MNFAEILQDSDVNRAPETHEAKFLVCYNQCGPIKTKTISSKDQLKTWIMRLLKQKVKKSHN